jgi:ribosome-associated translation inhibitor RaiA
MEVPLQITFHGVSPSDTLSELIRKEAEKLESFFDRIVSCHVRIEQEQRHSHSGKPFRVRIDLAVPGSELSVHEIGAMHADPALTIRGAFRRARRRLQEYTRKTPR